MRAIALMSMWKTRNAIRTLFSDPRKLIPFLIAVAFMAFSFSVTAMAAGQSRHSPTIGSVKLDPNLLNGALFLAMVMIAVGTIDTGLGDGLLAFGMPDVDYIFPSPISRRIVLAFRLPRLTVGSIFTALFLIYIYRMILRIIHLDTEGVGHTAPPWWFGPLAMALCVGIYLNLAMFLAILIEARKTLHRILLSVFFASAAILAVASYFLGLAWFTKVSNAPLLQVLFFPCSWAANALGQEVFRNQNPAPLWELAFVYLLSLIPMFATNANFYEQSIASSERAASWRKAAKAGLAAQQASRAASFKYKGSRTYTVKPFGTGAGALAWAHFSAAAKRPFANFAVPLLSGLGVGLLAAVVSQQAAEAGVGTLVTLACYLSFGFMASARTASESAVRRRELIAPLPIPSWEAVIANLAVPWVAMFGFCLFGGITYALCQATYWPMVAFGLCLFLPLRLGARMVLQYILVLGYPDFEDKIQQLIAQAVYYLFAVPFVIGEVIFAIPAILLHSVWIGMVTLTVLQLAYLPLFLYLAGVASSRAVASGEPVKLLNLASKKA